jgi:hypothetical protein
MGLNVWTGANQDGTANVADCTGWHSSSPVLGMTGSSMLTDSDWEYRGIASDCSNNYRIYCFQSN